jgi:monoamine oxidase
MTTTHKISPRAAFAHETLRSALLKEQPPFRTPGPGIGEPLASITGPVLPIGILGAGTAGLCAALMLQKLGRPFEILEASDRIGGRCFTYHFTSERYDYYDVGAMRFPDIPPMKPTFDMIKYVGIKDKLVPYYFKSRTGNTALLYNDYRYVPPPDPPVQTIDIWSVGVNEGGTVPQEIADQDPSIFQEKIFGPFGKAFASSFEEGWEMLKPFDSFSVRAYMEQIPIPNYPATAVTWFETTGFGTNMYDNSFTEIVMDYLEFGDPYAKVNAINTTNPWHCIVGGAEELPAAMYAKLGPGSVATGKRVTKIALSPDTENMITAVVADGTQRNYSQVISTMSLGCLQAVDLTGASLSYQQKVAIRCCAFTDSTKVGIKFKTRWWQKLPAPIVGGLGLTDRPTRTVVYPSYGVDDPNAPGTILASYNWSQDASRFGSLVQGHDSDAEKQLINIIFKDLSELHELPYSFFVDQYVDHHAWNWCHDEFTRGAFALYGPGQFTEMYPSITRPAGGGRLHFAGEATSVHHAWVAGALASAWRAVAEVLITDGMTPVDAEKVLVANGFSKPEEVDMKLLSQQIVLGSVIHRKDHKV